MRKLAMVLLLVMFISCPSVVVLADPPIANTQFFIVTSPLQTRGLRIGVAPTSGFTSSTPIQGQPIPAGNSSIFLVVKTQIYPSAGMKLRLGTDIYLTDAGGQNAPGFLEHSLMGWVPITSFKDPLTFSAPQWTPLELRFAVRSDRVVGGSSFSLTRHRVTRSGAIRRRARDRPKPAARRRARPSSRRTAGPSAPS
jgi:hypothetical protein